MQRDERMKKLQKKLFQKSVVTLFIASHAWAEEKIIQQENLSFERCLQVITTSQDKLSVAPEIKDLSEQKRIAVFTLIDGTLTITCDGKDSNVTVSTNAN